MKRQRWNPGNFVKIDLGDGDHAYGRVATSPQIAFLAGSFQQELEIDRISALPVAFRVWVYRSTVTSGVWPVIGHLLPSQAFLEEPYFRKQDQISGRLSLHHSSFAATGYEQPATLEQCMHLEAAAVWEADHIVSRIRDARDGRDNIWLKSLQIDASKIPVSELRSATNG